MNARADLLGMQIDPVSMCDVVARLLDWVLDNDRRCRYVVTPNVDHVVLFQEHEGLREAYRDASLVLADGFPVVLALRLLGQPVPERIAGSDLVPVLFEVASQAVLGGAAASDRWLRVFLLGAAPGVADRAAREIEARWHGVRVVGTDSPPLGFERRPKENDRILERIAAAEPGVLIVGLGAPKQELWVHAHHVRIAAPVALCVGATIDFLAGEKRRAPKWMRLTSLEWLHRMASDPKRLLRRYTRDAWLFPRICYTEWHHRRQKPEARGRN